MAGEDELQKVFREAAETMGKRILHNRQLAWKPGTLEQMSTNLSAMSALVSAEHGKLHPSGTTAGANAAQNATPAAPPAAAQARSPWTKAMPSGSQSPPARSTAAAGWTRAKPSGDRRPDAPVIGTRTSPPSLFSDTKKAALRMGTSTGAVELLHEGVLSGGDIFLKPDFSRPSAELGWKADGGPMVEKAIDGIVDMLRKSGLFDNIAIEGGKQFAENVASALPVIGAVITLSEAAAQTVNLALDKYRSSTLNKSAVHITPGQPRAALEAARRLYERHAAEMGARMTINYAAGGAAVGGLFLDFGAVTGPLTGIIKTVLNLVITIVNSCITLSEMREGNEIIRAGGPFDLTLIERCPILGTYLLTECERSVLYAFLVAKPLPANWKDEVTRLIPTMDGVVRMANVLQLRSPFELHGFAEDGSKIKTFAKGDHFLDTRLYKTPQRIVHEAGLMIRRDPNAVNSLKQHVEARTGIKLPGTKR